MTISLRLDDDQARRLELAAKSLGVSKSDLVRRCIADFLRNDKEQPTVWEQGRHLFGNHGSGKGDLSVRAEEIAREKVHAKTRHH